MTKLLSILLKKKEWLPKQISFLVIAKRKIRQVMRKKRVKFLTAIPVKMKLRNRLTMILMICSENNLRTLIFRD